MSTTLFPPDLTSVLVGVGVLLLLLCLWLRKSTTRGPPPPPRLPPGPWPALPLLGHLHLLGKDPRPQFLRWRRQYGDVFSLYLGGKLTVVLASYSAIKEVFVSMGEVFSYRPHVYLFDNITRGKGIGGSSGPLWKEQRKTGLEILREMGMGKNVLAEKIQEEITHYIRAIRDHQGAPVDLRKLTQASISNNICSIVFGKRFHYRDIEFNQYLDSADRLFELLLTTGVLNVLPAVRYLPGDLFKLKALESNVDAMRSFINRQVAHHQKALVDGNKRDDDDDDDDDTKENNDFIYSYLHRMRQRQTEGNCTTTLNEENLQQSVFDLILGGTETTSTSIYWALLYLLHHPEVQEKCFHEISDVLGPDRPPSMKDKLSLTYLEATILEVLRKGNIGPINAPRTALRDVMFRGYVIPEGCLVVSFPGCLMQDPAIWGDPENFRPERFIGPDGKLSNREELIPFGMGRRSCVGESLARMELFLYLTTLIQHFRFLPTPEEEDGRLPSLEGVLQLNHAPKSFKLRAVPRM